MNEHIRVRASESWSNNLSEGVNEGVGVVSLNPSTSMSISSALLGEDEREGEKGYDMEV